MFNYQSSPLLFQTTNLFFFCSFKMAFSVMKQVTNATDHVRLGNDALKTAKSLQKRSRKCMMIAIILLIVIAIIIVLAVLKPWKKWQEEESDLHTREISTFHIYIFSTHVITFNCYSSVTLILVLSLCQTDFLWIFARLMHNKMLNIFFTLNHEWKKKMHLFNRWLSYQRIMLLTSPHSLLQKITLINQLPSLFNQWSTYKLLGG